MLFHSSVRKELSRSFGATLIVLITVVMTMTLIRTLGQATRGSFAPQDIMLAMGFALLADTPSILSLSLFIAVITTLSRMYRDSEMVIWLGTGFGLLTLLRPLLRFAWPVFLVVAALSLLVLVVILAFFPVVLVYKVGEAVYVCADIGTNCLRSAWSDRW